MDELKPLPMSDAEIVTALLPLYALSSIAGIKTRAIAYRKEFAAIEAARDAQWLALIGELQRDAARYRWARLRYDGEGSIDLAFVPDPYWGPKNGDDLDAAIDAARGEKGCV